MPAPRKLPFLYEGEVTRRDDPDGLGRVKIRIAGIVEPETPNWAFPMGAPGGGMAQHGHWEPPPVGSNVDVFFKLGEIDNPRYLVGAWGDPGGVSDVPTNAAIDDDDGEPDKRQNAVTEDEAWRIERDSRNGSGRKHRYLISHKSSDLAVLIDADADKVFLVRDNANQALIRGTEYRSEEASMLSVMKTQLLAAGTALNTAGTDPVLDGLAHNAAVEIVSAATALTAAGNAISSNMTSSTEYLSEKAFTE